MILPTGISAFYHDSAACLVRDGEIFAAAQEEPFNRKKHDEGFPRNAVSYCLKAAGHNEWSPTRYGRFSIEEPFLDYGIAVPDFDLTVETSELLTNTLNGNVCAEVAQVSSRPALRLSLANVGTDDSLARGSIAKQDTHGDYNVASVRAIIHIEQGDCDRLRVSYAGKVHRHLIATHASARD
jgi:hypothetical protein